MRIFDKTVTNLDIVNNLQIQLDDCVPTASSGGDVASMSLSYAYQFRFATLGVTTQVYRGSSGSSGWTNLTYAFPTHKRMKGFLPIKCMSPQTYSARSMTKQVCRSITRN